MFTLNSFSEYVQEIKANEQFSGLVLTVYRPPGVGKQTFARFPVCSLILEFLRKRFLFFSRKTGKSANICQENGKTLACLPKFQTQ